MTARSTTTRITAGIIDTSCGLRWGGPNTTGCPVSIRTHDHAATGASTA